MNRKTLARRFSSHRIESLSATRPDHYRPRVEALEDRRMLAASDLLISTFDDTRGLSVVRYNEATQLPVPGGVATSGALSMAQGLAVAPDGTYFVSSLANAQVRHYDRNGNFLGTLGANDAAQAPIYAPGTLVFGPNGHLYVGDLGAGAVYEFDINSTTQQWNAAGSQFLGFTPGGIAFAPDASHDMIVGNLDAQAVVRIHNGVQTNLIGPGSGITPTAILAQANGDLLIADTDFGQQPMDHHQIVKYVAAQQGYSQFINLTEPLGPGNVPPQPTSLAYDTDGNLLVGLSPDHAGNGAIQKFNVTTGAKIATLVSGIGTPSGIGLIAPVAADLLLSTFDDTAGNSVLRYDGLTHQPTAGSVPTSADLAMAQGVVVAPDGSFYVSSLATAQVRHYDSSGNFLDVLGANDAVHAPIYAPGTLIFGPDGHLYVGDLGSGAVLEFDTTSTTQQWLASDSLFLGFTPGGIAFAPDSTHELIVGNLDAQSVIRMHNGVPTTLIAPGSGVTPTAIVTRPNGDLLIADTDFGQQPFDHHRIVLYNATSSTFNTFINLTTPTGAGGVPPQPTSLAYDYDGNLLVGVAPDHTGTGAIQKYNINNGSLIATLVSGIGTPSGIGMIPTDSSAVASRNLFYNNSKYDGNNPAANANDDGAIATNKSPYFADSGTATFANVSSYTRGINGIMIDVWGPHGTLTAADFSFKFNHANGALANTPSAWSAAPAPASITVRPGQGAGGSDRVEILWADNAVQSGWLQVTVNASANTGLSTDDVFYWGSAPADSGEGESGSAVTNIADENGARIHPAGLLSNIPVTNAYDYNRDGRVDSSDQSATRLFTNTALTAPRFINITTILAGAAPQIASDGGTTSAVASALTATGNATPSDVKLPKGILQVVSHVQSSHSPLAQLLQQWGQSNPQSVKKLVAEADRLASAFDLDEALVDGVLAKLGWT